VIFAELIPREARFGCWCNGHMKMRVGTGMDKTKYWVDRNDHGDPGWVKEECKRIKEEIEKAWEEDYHPLYEYEAD